MDDAGPQPGDDGESRPTVTLRPLFTYLMIFDLILGFVWGMLLFLITNLAGAPKAVQAVAMLSGIVVWIGSWWRTAIRFTPDELVVTRLIAPHHVPWYRVTHVSLYDMWDSDTDRVTGRRVDVRYRREAEPRSSPCPACSANGGSGTAGTSARWPCRCSCRRPRTRSITSLASLVPGSAATPTASAPPSAPSSPPAGTSYRTDLLDIAGGVLVR